MSLAWWLVGWLLVMLVIMFEGSFRILRSQRREVIEQCAKIADEHRARVWPHDPDETEPGDRVAQGYGNAALNIAIAIRRLNPKGTT